MKMIDGDKLMNEFCKMAEREAVRCWMEIPTAPEAPQA